MLTSYQRASLKVKLAVLGGGSVLFASAMTVLLLPGGDEFARSPTLAVLRAMLASVALASGVFAIYTARLLRSLGRLQRDLARLASGGEAELAPDPTADRDVRRLRSGFRTLAQQIDRLRIGDEQAREALERRSRTVDRLLEFSQIIQGVGRVQHVYSTLAHFLRTELQLVAVGIIEQGDGDDQPATLVARWPEDSAPRGGEFDCSACPCFRQSLPRCFNDTACPVRCGVEGWLGIPASLPAFCVPIVVANRRRAVVHLARDAALPWDEESRQLAQTFVNAAAASIVVLDLLEDAQRKSMTDGLTGLYNRRSMDQLLVREAALAERHGQPLSLVAIDLDHFKPINDRHGHAAGDFLLKTFADCIRSTLRRTDLAFRPGGDEFVIALPQTSYPQAMQVVAKLKAAFAAADFSQAIANLERRPTLSAGIATLDRGAGIATLPHLLEAADQAMYRAKQSSRDPAAAAA
jgi:diguanylate cyclase (GGDEF)-like protein